MWGFVRWFIYTQLFLWSISLFRSHIERFMSSRIDKALDEAKTLYEQGAKHGEIPAMKRTAQLYREQEKYSKAVYWHEKLMKKDYIYHYDESSSERFVAEYQRKQPGIKAQEIFSKIRSEHYARNK